MAHALITAFYASLIALLMLFLAYRVSTYRHKLKVGLGDAGDKDIQVAIRAHANITEYAPITIILLFLAELNGLNALWLHIAGASLIVARLAYAWGYIRSSGTTSHGRFYGTLVTWLIITALAISNIVFFLKSNLFA